MDVTCSVQDNIHMSKLDIYVSRILGTHHNDNDLTMKTVLNKYPSIGVLEHGGIIKSRKMSELTPVNGKLYE